MLKKLMSITACALLMGAMSIGTTEAATPQQQPPQRMEQPAGNGQQQMHNDKDKHDMKPFSDKKHHKKHHQSPELKGQHGHGSNDNMHQLPPPAHK